MDGTKEQNILEKGLSAEAISKEFKEHSVAEFFKKNMQMLGLTGKIKTLTTIIHEYLTNSLDACEEAHTLPEIEVQLNEIGNEYYEVIVKDNGPGLTKETVGKAFGKLLAGTKFHRMVQMRGQQGIGCCMTGDTLIPLSNGEMQPIKEIVEEKSSIGKKVLSLDLNDFKIKPKKITKLWKIKNSKIVEIKTGFGRKINLTPENPVLCIEKGQPVWKLAGKITPNDFVAIPINMPANHVFVPNHLIDYFDWSEYQVNNKKFVEKTIKGVEKKYGTLKKAAKALKINYGQLRNWTRKMENKNPRGRPSINNVFLMAKKIGITKEKTYSEIKSIGRNGNFIKMPLHLNTDLCWFVGAMAGDGHIDKKETNRWGTNLFFHNASPVLIRRVKKILKTQFGLKPREYFDARGNGTNTLEFSSSTLAKLLNQLGVPCGNKCNKIDLDNKILKNSKFANAAIQGLFDTDGSAVTSKQTIYYSSKSKKIIQKTKSTLLRNGIVGGINERKETGVYSLTISGKENLKKFLEKISFSHPEKRKKLQKIIKSIPKTISYSIPTIDSEMKMAFKEAKIALNSKLPPSVYSALYNGFTRETLTKAVDLLKKNKFSKEKAKLFEKLAQSDVIWTKPVSITRKKNSEPFVYDFEVEGHHNFIANDVVVHNSGCTMLSQITTGKPSQIITGTGTGSAFSVEITIDPKKNEPKLSNIVELKKPFKGTAIKSKFKNVKYINSEVAPLEYLRRSAIANPHATIIFTEPNGTKHVFERTSKTIPKKPIAMKPHPKGVTVDDLMTLSKTTKARKVNSFIKEEFDRTGDKAIEEIAKKVSFDLNKDPRQLEWDETEEIIKQFKRIDFIAPRTDGLRPIGEERIKKSLENKVQPEFMSVVTRKPQVYSGGFPFQVETAVMFGGNAGRMSNDKDMEGRAVRKVEIMRFANNVPLLFDTGGCAISKAVQSIEWKRYGIRDPENAPLTIFVNLISVHIPYTSAGKQAISDEDEIMEELRLGLMDVGRKIFRYIGFRRREEEKQKKRKLFYKYATEVANAVGELTGKNSAEIKTRLHKIILNYLKMEEAQEEKLKEKMSEDASEEEVEKHYEKQVAKEKKEKEKKGKKVK
jgi:DNA topoisomerase VI subunit B